MLQVLYHLTRDEDDRSEKDWKCYWYIDQILFLKEV